MRSVVLSIVMALTATLVQAGETQVDPFGLHLEAPIKTWDEGVPLGNGLTGGLLWGEGNIVNVSLDRGDLWDERLPEIYQQKNWNYATIKALKAAGNQAEISRLFDAPYNEAAPTKLPGGRLVITLDSGKRPRMFDLDMKRACGRVEWDGGGLDGFFSATQPVAMFRVRGSGVALDIVRPDGLNRLGYPPAAFGKKPGMTWMTQQAASGLTYGVVVASRRVGEQTQIAVAITTNRDANDPLELARKRAAAALDSGYEKLFAAHKLWWEKFWSTSDVHLPEARLQRHYNLVKYFYGAASRPDAPPIPLQGVWTADNGGLPPWKGDYHNDLNTQMTYLAYHTAGLFDAGMSFIQYNWDRLPRYRAFASEFYGVQGAAVPGVETLDGHATGGWAQYSLSPTNGLWVGQSFYLHWRYTMDRQFLAKRAYPWLSEVASGIVNLLEPRDGKLYLPLSSSPEIHDNSLRAWLKPNSNYDLALMKWAFGALAEMADALELSHDAARWRKLESQLEPLHIDAQDVLMFAAGEPFAESHRHHSHAMAIHPLGILNIDGSARDRAVIHATLARMEELGTQAWCGYSFSWFACMLARAGDGDGALRYLSDFERAFILRNGFHANGDQTSEGLSRFHYRPFTLEGNFLAMQAVQEMLLQSWGGRVRIFPATPSAWRDVSFDRLRAEGGFIVSAQRIDGRTHRVSITATVDQELRLVQPFAGRPFHADLDVQTIGDDLRCPLKAGQTLTLVDTTSPNPVRD